MAVTHPRWVGEGALDQSQHNVLGARAPLRLGSVGLQRGEDILFHTKVRDGGEHRVQKHVHGIGLERQRGANEGKCSIERHGVLGALERDQQRPLLDDGIQHVLEAANRFSRGGRLIEAVPEDHGHLRQHVRWEH